MGLVNPTPEEDESSDKWQDESAPEGGAIHRAGVCPNCETESDEMHPSAPWWVCENPRCAVVHFCTE